VNGSGDGGGGVGDGRGMRGAGDRDEGDDGVGGNAGAADGAKGGSNNGGANGGEICGGNNGGAVATGGETRLTNEPSTPSAAEMASCNVDRSVRAEPIGVEPGSASSSTIAVRACTTLAPTTTEVRLELVRPRAAATADTLSVGGVRDSFAVALICCVAVNVAPDCRRRRRTALEVASAITHLGGDTPSQMSTCNAGSKSLATNPVGMATMIAVTILRSTVTAPDLWIDPSPPAELAEPLRMRMSTRESKLRRSAEPRVATALASTERTDKIVVERCPLGAGAGRAGAGGGWKGLPASGAGGSGGESMSEGGGAGGGRDGGGDGRGGEGGRCGRCGQGDGGGASGTEGDEGSSVGDGGGRQGGSPVE